MTICVQSESDKPRYSVDYAITLTISRKLRKLTPEEQYDRIKLLLPKVMYGCEYTLITELHKDMNTHYHGIFRMQLPIQGRTVVRSITDRIRKIDDLGFYVIKQIDNFGVWSDYIQKAITQTALSIARPVILQDDYQIVPQSNIKE